jgi:hypothetical protein
MELMTWSHGYIMGGVSSCGSLRNWLPIWASNMRERILSICSQFIEKSLAGCGNWFSIFLTFLYFSFFFVSLIKTLNPPYLSCFVEVAMIVAKSYPLIFSVFLPFLYLFLLCFFDQNPKPSFSCMFHWGSHNCCQLSSIDIFGISSFSRW